MSTWPYATLAVLNVSLYVIGFVRSKGITNTSAERIFADRAVSVIDGQLNGGRQQFIRNFIRAIERMRDLGIQFATERRNWLY